LIANTGFKLLYPQKHFKYVGITLLLSSAVCYNVTFPINALMHLMNRRLKCVVL